MCSNCSLVLCVCQSGQGNAVTNPRKKTSTLVVKVHGWFIFSFYLNLCEKEVTLSHEVVSVSIKPFNKCVKMLLNWDLLEKMSSQ